MEKELNTVYLGLGSNIGDKTINLQKAILLIEAKIGVVSKKSNLFYSSPQGFQSPNDFVNMAVKLSTVFDPFELLDGIEEIEKVLGRTEKSNGIYKDRMIDIDILLFNQEVINHVRLTIPHPLIDSRDFVHIPLSQIMDNKV